MIDCLLCFRLKQSFVHAHICLTLVTHHTRTQTEIAKRLNAICAQVIPFLSQEHQQQVAAAVERAKQVTTSELHAIIGVSTLATHWGTAVGFIVTV